jgi:hypothetical protein
MFLSCSPGTSSDNIGCGQYDRYWQAKKIYLVLEYVSGVELFSKIVRLRTTWNLYLDHGSIEIITKDRLYWSLYWDMKLCWSEFTRLFLTVKPRLIEKGSV